jgi:hypothetical protein
LSSLRLTCGRTGAVRVPHQVISRSSEALHAAQLVSAKALGEVHGSALHIMLLLKNLIRALLMFNGFSNNSPPPLIVTMASLGRLSPRSRRRSIARLYIELWHELWRAITLALTLYHICLYRPEVPWADLPILPDAWRLLLCLNFVYIFCSALEAWAAPHGRG